MLESLRDAVESVLDASAKKMVELVELE